MKENTVVNREELNRYACTLLEAERFADYGPNGLQVEGRQEVRRLVSGVTASLELIEAAIAQRADALVVHHGLFWRGQDGRITGWMKQRLAALLRHDLNLLAFHLPLDAHPTLGNNAQLGQRLGLTTDATFGDKNLGCIGTWAPADGTDPEAGLPFEALLERVDTVLGRTPVAVRGSKRPVRRVAWCTGGAQDYFEAAIAAGADAFLTGEISEPQMHLAKECGVAFLACGHHATERYGAQALGTHLAEQFGLEHTFIDLDNPA